MKILLWLFGISEYVGALEDRVNRLKINQDTDLATINELLTIKYTLTAEVITLREQVETLEQSNSEYLSVNEDLIKENKKLNNIKEQLMDAVTYLVNIVNADYD